jgi:hypothetical protein
VQVETEKPIALFCFAYFGLIEPYNIVILVFTLLFASIELFVVA